MPRKATGNVIREGDHFVARVQLDGKRERIHLQPGLSEEKARATAEFYTENPEIARKTIESQKAQKSGIAPIPKGETFAQYLARWFDDRDKRGFAAIKGDWRFLEKHVCPHIGERSIADITREDIEKLVQHLDEKTAQGEWAWRSARRTWNLLRKLFSDTCKSKNLALRVRKDNPTNDVAPPDSGEEKAKAFLWPNEFLRLMTCEQIPLGARRLYAIAIYLYSRASEILVLRWTDIDLDNGTITICRGYDRERKQEKSTKAGRVRLFAIEPNLLPLLRAMYAERQDDGRIIPVAMGALLALQFRRHLWDAGITRPDLFLDDDQHIPIRFHDARSTACTWMAMRGDPVTTIMERVGHKEFATTQVYLRRADALRGRIGEPFPELPACLLGTNPSNASGDDGGGKGSGIWSNVPAVRSELPTFQGKSTLDKRVPTTFDTLTTLPKAPKSRTTGPERQAEAPGNPFKPAAARVCKARCCQLLHTLERPSDDECMINHVPTRRFDDFAAPAHVSRILPYNFQRDI